LEKEQATTVLRYSQNQKSLADAISTYAYVVNAVLPFLKRIRLTLTIDSPPGVIVEEGKASLQHRNAQRYA
jgi:hypothetical protein